MLEHEDWLVGCRQHAWLRTVEVTANACSALALHSPKTCDQAKRHGANV